MAMLSMHRTWPCLVCGTSKETVAERLGEAVRSRRRLYARAMDFEPKLRVNGEIWKIDMKEAYGDKMSTFPHFEDSKLFH